MRRIALLGFVWGWSFFFVKKALPGFTPWSIAFGRTLLGALTLFVVIRIRGMKLPTDASMFGHLSVLALVSNAIPFATQSVAQTHISSTLTSVLNATTPLFTAVLGALLFSQRLRGPQMIGLLLGITGVSIAAGVGANDLRGAAILGVVLMLCSTLSYGMSYHYAQRKVSGRLQPEVIAFGQLLIASVLLLVPAVISTLGTVKRPNATNLVALGALGILGTGIAWILNFRNIADVGPARASTVTFIVPIVAFLLGVGLLHEPLRLRHLIGGALTLFAVAVLQERIRWRRSTSQAQL